MNAPVATPPATPVAIPLAEIDDNVLPRDRLTLDEGALASLTSSIILEGLRQPVELFGVEYDNTGPGAESPPYGLISGLRRVTVFRRLDALDPGGRYAAIPAFLRNPESIPAAMTAMVSENEMCSPVTPWEKGSLILRCIETGLFPNLDTATEALFPALTRRARSRLRGFALVAETLDGALTEPRSLSTARMDRLAAACRAGLSDLMGMILADHTGAAPETQWRALAPAIAEAVLTPEDPELAPGTARAPRPRRALHLKSGITLRREWTRTGWIIRINAKHAAHPGIVDDILDHVEEWFQKE